MKKNKWNSIRIKGPELDRSILCSYLENYVLGIEYNHNSARVFLTLGKAGRSSIKTNEQK